MTKLLNATLLTKAIFSFALDECGKNVIISYANYDKHDDNSTALKFSKRLCKLNSYAKEHGFGSFILKALESDEESIEFAKQAYDVFNELSAINCDDSYTKVAN